MRSRPTATCRTSGDGDGDGDGMEAKETVAARVLFRSNWEFGAVAVKFDLNFGKFSLSPHQSSYLLFNL